MAGPVQLLDLFTFVAPATSGTYRGPWVPFPSVFKNASLWIDTKTHDVVSQILVTVFSTTDMDAEGDPTPGGVVVTTPGLRFQSISQKLGPWVRIEVANNHQVARAVISAWLLPKRE